MTEPKLYSIEEVAALKGVQTPTIKYLIRRLGYAGAKPSALRLTEEQKDIILGRRAGRPRKGKKVGNEAG